MLKAVVAALGLICGLAFADSAQAQVRGVCVSGCNIPAGPATPLGPMPPDPRINIIGAKAFVRGDVQIRTPDGRTLDARVAFDGAVPLGSIVSTGPGARLQILLPDESIFTIGPGGEFVLDEFVYDPATSAGKVSARVVKGEFRFVTGKVGHHNPENVKIGTPVVAIGIRGTDFEVNVDPGGTGYILLNQGEVYLTEYDTERVFTLHPGQRLTFENFVIKGVE